MVISSKTVGSYGARFDTSSLAIVELILDNLPKIGTPAQVLYVTLQAAFSSDPDAIKFIRCEFDVLPDQLETHQDKMKNIAESLKL